MVTERGGLYIHVAYCRSKCKYCDFFSGGDRHADWQRYTDSLIRELKSRNNENGCPFRTVYIGGGTPSLMPAEEFLRLNSAIAPYTEGAEEFTLEANPDDITEERLRVWKEGGVNRLSIGIQTFHDSLLSAIGRRHDAETALKAYGTARMYFSNVSIDLMFGLPGQTLDMWREDISKAVELKPEHISAYTLMYEPGTVMTALRDAGRFMETPEETVLEMYRTLTDELRGAGYEHYEISNFAIPGCRSRHNTSYWTQLPYVGIGPSAHSYDGHRIRKANRPDLPGYLEGRDISETEILSDDELREEFVMTRLRTKEGIPLKEFSIRFGDTSLRELLEDAMPLQADGSLANEDGHLHLTEKSVIISDSVMVALI